MISEPSGYHARLSGGSSATSFRHRKCSTRVFMELETAWMIFRVRGPLCECRWAGVRSPRPCPDIGVAYLASLFRRERWPPEVSGLQSVTVAGVAFDRKRKSSLTFKV